MKIIKIKHIEDCFDGSYIKELLFDDAVNREFILQLGQKGDLNYLEDFSRPFFKVMFRDDFYLKGVQGNYSVRVFLRDQKDIEHIQYLLKEGG